VSVRPVTRGQATGEKIVIASGLKAGEQVITEGADRLKEGSRVSLAGDAPRGGSRRQGASAPQGAASATQGASSAAAPAGAVPSAMPQRAAPANAAPGAPPGPPTVAANPSVKTAGPSAEQRQRMLEQVKDNPEALERRKRFLEKIDSGDAEALERWQSMQQRMQQGGGQGFGAGGGPGRERPPQ
jgi:multidrug efflux system membrane fusion protein